MNTVSPRRASPNLAIITTYPTQPVSEQPLISKK